MAEKTKKPGFFSRYIGGLLGEDAESMTQDDRRRATLSLLGSFGRNYLSAGSGDESLAAMRASRVAERKAVDDARRTAAAQAMMPDVASRIFGGTGGRSIEALPGAGGEAMPLTARRVPTREGAMEALNIFSSTQAGRDAAAMAPGLVDFAKEGVTGRNVGDSVYNPLTDRFTARREPKKIVETADLTDRVIVSYSDGTEKIFMKGAAPRAPGGGGERFKILSPAEVLAAGLKPGSIYQQNTVTNQITPMPGQDSGGLGEVELRQYNAADLAIKNARSNIQNLTDTLARVPATSAIAGEGRGELEGAYTLALGAVRELQNSGVLNVGEIPFLEKALRDPTTFSSIVASPLKRKELAGQIRTIMTLLAQKESNLNKVYFPGKPPPQNATPSAANPVVPTNQSRPPNPEARARAENYYQSGD